MFESEEFWPYKQKIISKFIKLIQYYVIQN